MRWSNAEIVSSVALFCVTIVCCCLVCCSCATHRGSWKSLADNTVNAASVSQDLYTRHAALTSLIMPVGLTSGNIAYDQHFPSFDIAVCTVDSSVKCLVNSSDSSREVGTSGFIPALLVDTRFADTAMLVRDTRVVERAHAVDDVVTRRDSLSCAFPLQFDISLVLLIILFFVFVAYMVVKGFK